MANLTQVRFLGASITSFNSVVGWNGQNSQLDVSLVEDIRNGDAFLPPEVGAPVIFNYQAFQFAGILQNVTVEGSSGGNPLYKCIVVDPRILLNGVRVILGDYAGSVGGVPNLVNVYGFYEFSEFGLSGSNGGGMTWDKIRNALNLTVALAGDTIYGGPIKYRGYNYTLNLSNLPILPSYFRLSGSMSLMEIISQVCEAGGCDFFCELVGTAITFYTISRLNIPNTGVIAKYIAVTPGAVSKQIGQDMVNDVTGKFVVGGKVRQMYYSSYGGASDNAIDNAIWWFWGFDKDGNPVLGNGYSDNNADNHTFYLDSRGVQIEGVRDVYPTSIGEMRAALVGQDEWEDFLRGTNNLPSICDLNGITTDSVVPITGADELKFNNITWSYPSNGKPNPHFSKALNLGLQDPDNANFILEINGKQIENISYDFTRTRMVFPGVLEDETSKLYDMIRGIAEENYGTRIMVALPYNIQVAYDLENNRPIFSQQPCDGGYIDESQLQTAAQTNLIPLDLNAITDDMNLYKPMVRFDDIANLDFSQVDESSIVYSADGNSIFIICSVDSEVFFTNGLNNPRVVLKIPGRVTAINYSIIGLDNTPQFLLAASSKSNFNAQEQSEFEETLASNYPPNTLSQFAVLPSVAIVPLESNVDRYGPWFAQGAIGAIDFEENESLTPWNYGTYSNMTLAGEALVTENISNLQIIESGAIEFPGAPDHNLGRQLLETGPYISNISVSVGSEGVKTSYRMEMWKPKFGTLNRIQAEQIAKVGKLYNMLRRNMLEKIKINRRVK